MHRSGRWWRGLTVVAVALAGTLPTVRMGASGADGRTVADAFPLGVFEDGNLIGDAATFAASIDDLRAHHLDSIWFVNTRAADADAFLSVADARRFGVYWYALELGETWWPGDVPATIERAREVVHPLVDGMAGDDHPSLKGYNLADEPRLEQAEKLALAVRAFRERDPSRPAMPVLIGVDRAERLLPVVAPDVMVIDVYPVAGGSAPCAFTMDGFGYPGLDVVDYVRRVTSTKPAATPFWVILQTHRFGAGTEPWSLREPTVAEVRAQHWLAIGEGATGIFWFVYGSQQGWTGLRDNPALYAEVADLAARTTPLRATLIGLRRSPDRFAVAGDADAHVSTLASPDGRRLYAVVVNRSCADTAGPAVVSAGLVGRLRDAETGAVYEQGEAIALRPGDGRLLELIGGP